MGSKFLLSLCFILGYSAVYAQTHSISGYVYDKQENTPLPGAAVYLEDQIVSGTVTDIDGHFVLGGVPSGTQTIVVTYLGFVAEKVSLEIPSSDEEELQIGMEPAPILGKEVLVTAQALGQAKAINQQLNAESISNIVSSDRIQELPDVNAAEAIARLPGVSINRSGGEGQKIVVRGLEPKFNAITVNGVRLPANDASDRSVDLSLISPEMLEGIELFKAPLPYMDAEVIGGTVNLNLRRAASDLKVIAKLLGGYNDLHNDWRDYKGVLQGSKRLIKDKLGVVLQGSIERFNRGGDFLTYAWTSGATDRQTGITEILGSQLRLRDRAEIRRRRNGSVNLDYDLGRNHSLNFFGLYSKTDRDRFEQQERYDPDAPEIEYRAQSVQNDLILSTMALGGEHPLGGTTIEWNMSRSTSQGTTPYNFDIEFRTSVNPFDLSLNQTGHPRTFFGAATPNLGETLLRGNDHFSTNTFEESTTGSVDYRIPLSLGENVGGYLKFGGKYFAVDRSRVVKQLSENFYYLGGEIVKNASEAYDAENLTYLAANSSLISILSFTEDEPIDYKSGDGSDVGFTSSLDPDIIRAWYDAQNSLLSNNRESEDDNYEVKETIAAGYFMLRLNFGKNLTIIPGFRFEQSDNQYTAGISTLSGRYGTRGKIIDTTTYQKYGEFLPHLHLKYQPLHWFDIRASYSGTLARPDYRFLTPRAEISMESLTIDAGNPNLRHAKATNYDLLFSAYKGGLGLLTLGFFYKEVDDIFYERSTQLADPDIAAANGWPARSGYLLDSYTNADRSTVRGFEIDLQTNFAFLPKPFNGIVLSANYSRLYSKTQVFFLTSETVLITPIPPIFETTYTSNARVVSMPSQPPHILHFSLGYDYKRFSARVSGIFQGTKANSYSLSKDFDSFTLEFWRWDASIKQDFGKYWSFFLNLNNFSNQQDITFIRNESYLNTIETYGFTSTAGLQFAF